VVFTLVKIWKIWKQKISEILCIMMHEYAFSHSENWKRYGNFPTAKLNCRDCQNSIYNGEYSDNSFWRSIYSIIIQDIIQVQNSIMRITLIFIFQLVFSCLYTSTIINILYTKNIILYTKYHRI